MEPKVDVRSQAAAEPFKYVGGDASVDLVNTVDWTASGPANERLADYDALVRWAEGAALLSSDEADRLRAFASKHPEAAESAHARALRLRALLRRLYASVAAGERAGPAWDELDEELASALRRLRVTPRSGTKDVGVATWEWSREGAELQYPFWPVLWAAAHLLTSEDAARIRVCAGQDCGWIYVDRSRNRMRRWCEMETCGTAAKTRRRRERRRAEREGT